MRVRVEIPNESERTAQQSHDNLYTAGRRLFGLLLLFIVLRMQDCQKLDTMRTPNNKLAASNEYLI